MFAQKEETKFSTEERKNYEAALRKMHRQVIKTAMVLGQSNLECMERGVAEIKLQMVLDQMLAPAFLSPSDRFEALRWFNWGVGLINGVRAATGQNILLIQAGFRRPLSQDASNGWN